MLPWTQCSEHRTHPERREQPETRFVHAVYHASFRNYSARILRNIAALSEVELDRRI